MIVEVETSYSDAYNNYVVESWDIPIDDNENPKNVEVIIEDNVVAWFYTTAKEFFEKVPEKDYDKYLDGTFFDYK